jgi:hypothetical protein
VRVEKGAEQAVVVPAGASVQDLVALSRPGASLVLVIPAPR